MATDFIAGLSGGFAGTVSVHPMDTIKTRLQVQSGHSPRYKGAFHCAVSIVKQESFLSLYKGMASPALTISTLNSVLFGSYGISIRRLDPERLSNHFLAGAIAGLVQSPLACTIELTKVRVQMQGIGEKAGHVKEKHYTGSINALYRIMRSEGILGCFRGQVITSIRDPPGFGTYFFVYEGLCRMLKDPETGDLPFIPLMVAGGLAGMASFACIYPLDVVKTKYQIDGIGKKSIYSSYVDVAREIYKHKGVKGFFSGLTITMIRTFPSNAAIFGTVSLTHRLLD